MATCPKCNTVNDDGLTRCRACNAILPVRLGSKSAARWERVRRQPDLVGTKCPNCGMVNPYTRLRCKSCNAILSKKAARSGIDKFWVLVGIGVVVIAVLLAVASRSM